VDISVIIPTLNEAARIESAVTRAWQAGAHEVIVVDGGSQDATSILARQAGGQVKQSPPGRGCQLNLGARSAAGEVLLFQHADSWLDPACIGQVRRALTDPRVLGGAFRQRIEAKGLRFRLLEWGNAWRARRLGLPYGDQGIFVRHEVFEQLGGFPEVPLMEDLILMRALRRQAWPILLPGPIHVDARRWRRHGVVRQTLRNWSLATAFRLGVAPERLARFYRRHDR
jgi:rSAM/selenodomain-associated transferase 2